MERLQVTALAAWEQFWEPQAQSSAALSGELLELLELLELRAWQQGQPAPSEVELLA